MQNPTLAELACDTAKGRKNVVDLCNPKAWGGLELMLLDSGSGVL